MTEIYICEECNFKSDKLKMCHKRKMIPLSKATQYSKNPCNCS